jgi:hypothetical protein
MKNVWSIACRNSVIDEDTKSLSLFESLEGINISHKKKLDLDEIKIIPISFHVVSLWVAEKTETNRKFDVLVEVLDWQKKSLKTFEQKCEIPMDKKRLRVITKIDGFGFTNEGEYKIIVKYRENNKPYKRVSEIPIDIAFNLVK